MDYKIGQKFEIKKIFTLADAQTFADLTGDSNPVHLNTEFATTTKFKMPVVHGALTNSLFSTIFGTIFPGSGCIYLSQTTKFVKPVYYDQLVIAQVELLEVGENKIALLSTKCLNELGELFLTGEAKVLLP